MDDDITMSDTKTLAIELLQVTNPHSTIHPDHNRIPISQTQHRLNLLTAWFGSLETARTNLANKTVLEIGCGQGDMTVALAWAVGPSGTVHAIDPAPLDYGSPETLGEAQSRISASALGSRIQWRQCEPVEGVRVEPSLLDVDYIVLAHSLLYMRNTDYVAGLLRAISPDSSTPVDQITAQLLIAEWGMQVSDESAKAHLYAVQAQAAQPLVSGNVQLYIEPKLTVELALSAGWRSEGEVWMQSPELDDGKWEVAATRFMPITDDTAAATRELSKRMEGVSLESVRCMDVWTCVFHR